ncbi:SusC/RagA family TonB-linked outer membrane protein [Flavisolibacter tropicus]|uniref:TonB-dependent receptor n=1 Tax=Flavisolibacter tropicus TaxID=1492898 RepID=A0A172TRV7_9BACT|nr:TonB-dependent receptor [Flavisolibacter tropicus]ANE49722.1 TonB-dependent receptor [Flavisolibacter tropicus]
MNRKVLLSLLFMWCSAMAFAQSRQVTGRITKDGSTEVLSGVSVTVKGSKSVTTTNADGQYTITVPGDNAVLIFSYVGMQPREINIGNNQSISLALKETASTLGDVVVVGYQTVRRRDLTGSVSSVSAKQLRDVPINSAAEALTGRLAGVQINLAEGAPNAEAVIRVRGGGSITQSNAPLYVVDGIQVENALSVIAPQDIETVDVLKDASATAIYGARGANGVIIITTKGGKQMKPTITYSGMVGVRQLANKLDVMKPYDFVLYQYERSRGSSQDENTFRNTYGTFDDLELYKNAPFVDWQDQMFGRDALMQTHNISLAGGTAATKYNLSLTSNTEEGIMRGSDFDRKIVNFRFDQTITNKLKAGFNVRYNHTTVNGAGTANAGSSATNRLRHSVKYRPVLMGDQDLMAYDPDYALETNANGLSLVNPILLNDAEYRKNLDNILNLNGSFTYDINKYLSFRSTIGFDVTNTTQNAFDDTITTNARSNSNMPIASINTISKNTFNNSNVLTFTMKKSGTRFSNKNDLDVLLGQEIYENKYKRNYIETRYFPVGISPERALGNMGLGTAPVGASQPPPVSTDLTDKIFSLFGRVNYAFDDKYLATLTVRGDGSSKFPQGNKWSYFPSASLAWRVSEEPFFQHLKSSINDLKFRLSYGEAGNNRIGDFLYLTQYTSNIYYSLNDQLVTAYNLEDLANANLKWETTIARNIGVDLSLLNNRLQVSADFYKNTTEDLLVRVTVPTSSGYTTQLQNVGATSNRGVELQINGTPIQKKNFNWTANFNISYNKNKVESLGQYQKSFLFSSGWAGSNQPSDYIVRVGDPVGAIWGLQTDGYYKIEDFDYNNGVYTLKAGVPTNQSITSLVPQPGVIKFKDISGPEGKADGIVDDRDRTVIGNTQPKFFGGLNQQFTYKNFDVSLFLNYQIGNDVLNANRLEFTSGYTVNSNLLEEMNNRWRNVNDQGQVVTDPTALAALNANATLWSPLRSASSFYVHSWAVEDGSFLRVNNITLGYTLPSRLLEKVKITKLRVYGTVNNLAVFTNYSGYDPEVNTRRSTPMTPGVDYSAYPRSRAFIFGANLSF